MPGAHRAHVPPIHGAHPSALALVGSVSDTQCVRIRVPGWTGYGERGSDRRSAWGVRKGDEDCAGELELGVEKRTMSDRGREDHTDVIGARPVLCVLGGVIMNEPEVMVAEFVSSACLNNELFRT